MRDKALENYKDKITRLKNALANADAVIVGAGAGLSTSAGFVYSGERFQTYFRDFSDKYGFKDMYSGGFYPYESMEENWAYWSRYIMINRYVDAPKPVYGNLLKLVKDKDYFVLTTNVDHCFQKVGFDKSRLFYTQGDFGLFQCSKPCHNKTYDNSETVKEMALSQGFMISENGAPCAHKDIPLKMKVPTELIPHCPVCGRPVSMNLRADDTFVEDEGWHEAAERYGKYIDSHKDGRVLFLELGVGFNTPGIIKYPFREMTADNKDAVYCCINYGDAACPDDIKERAICINGDIDSILGDLL